MTCQMYGDKTTISHRSLPIYIVYTIDPMLFCVDSGAPYSCIREKALEKIVRHFGSRSIPTIDSKREFKFGDTLVRSTEIVKPM